MLSSDGGYQGQGLAQAQDAAGTHSDGRCFGQVLCSRGRPWKPGALNVVPASGPVPGPALQEGGRPQEEGGSGLALPGHEQTGSPVRLPSCKPWIWKALEGTGWSQWELQGPRGFRNSLEDRVQPLFSS